MSMVLLKCRYGVAITISKSYEMNDLDYKLNDYYISYVGHTDVATQAFSIVAVSSCVSDQRLLISREPKG